MNLRSETEPCEGARKILAYLREADRKRDIIPTYREIGRHCGIDSTGYIHYCISQLERLGYIERVKGAARSIRLLKPDRLTAGLRRIPLMGRIQAGEPLQLPDADFNFYDIESSIDIAASQLPAGEGLFALEVQGDSMIDALINQGDIIILQPVQVAHSGQMVAALLDGETTLKYFFKEKGEVILQPANPAYPPIRVADPESLRIQGRVVHVMRCLLD